MSNPSYRQMLAGGAAILLSVTIAQTKVSKGELPFQMDSEVASEPVTDSSWRFFTMEEGRVVEALVDRLIPPDAETPGGRGAGCALFVDHFVDRQLAGSYGRFVGHYGSSAFATR